MSKSWRFAGNEMKYIEEVLDNGFRAGADGAMTERVEALFAETFGQPFAIAFNSGTSTLHAALAAFGVGPGDEVIIPNLSPIMCGVTPVFCGATPVYADVGWDDFLLDPVDVRAKITDKTKAIMPVHLYGQVCDMDAIMALAREFDLKVIEDCAECFLGTDAKGRVGGTIGDAGSWSFEASKHLVAGEGGMITCQDENLAMEIRKFGGLGFANLTARSGKVRIDRDKFQNPDWQRHDRIGFNYRMSELTGAVALAQTERIVELVDLRIAAGNGYRDLLAKSELLRPQKLPAGEVNSCFTFAARFEGLEQDIAWDAFRMAFIKNGGDGIYACWQLIGEEPAMADKGIGWGETPVAKKLQRRIMQFTSNQRNAEEREVQQNALRQTLNEFGDTV
ncbi:MAG: DegT/DnrJ/EryC1/StrS aminotransferase family protein [Rhodospirillaceae bacterium]|jgi:perosamine synthetase|nr:DegT/DnrJ/EryC1/StrS aminotransferase family protein [Rhodospirillaceae bacterium]MBT5245535.1 DegT/DnrJ/EryC1/StrS aminotransferase family protein [Rhodospirillaceae bacterium]MBT5561017.1 DegT/DnrJ/EryC1/StrS aminotransferase family protein [Rhodospirillaceae bacterium]MBT6240653.1 DegT/DnrJ/EryC1/StrS aminotransferase family protein [Rhodospirillaceae bacterium]